MEAEVYWKRVALWMADVLAATAETQVSRSRVGSGEKSRQIRIAQMAADALEGNNCPTVRDEAAVIRRLRSVEALKSDAAG